MKKINIVIIAVLVALCAVGWISMATTQISESSENKNYIEQADVYFEKGLYQRAIASYEVALKEKPTQELYEKMYLAYDARYTEAQEDTIQGFMSFLEKATAIYPSHEQFVDKLKELYIIESKDEDLYNLLKNAIDNGYNSEENRKLLLQVKYSFKIRNAEYSKINLSIGDYYAAQRTLSWNLTHLEDGYIWSTEYDYVGIPNDKGVAVAVGKDSRIIDATGMVLGIFENQVSEAGVYSEGLLPACINGSYGFYNDFAELQFGDYEMAGMFQNGLAAVKQNGKWFLVNAKGEIKSDEYEEIILDYAGRYLINETVLVKKSESVYVICNEDLKEISEISCTDVDIITENGLIAICQNGLWGFANTKGEIVIEPSYENARSFSNGVAAVCKDGLWGFVDVNNNLVIDFQFTDAGYMSENGTCIVRTDVVYEETLDEQVPNEDSTTTPEQNEPTTDENESVKIEELECWQFLQLNLGIMEE